MRWKKRTVSISLPGTSGIEPCLKFADVLWSPGMPKETRWTRGNRVNSVTRNPASPESAGTNPILCNSDRCGPACATGGPDNLGAQTVGRLLELLVNPSHD